MNLPLNLSLNLSLLMLMATMIYFTIWICANCVDWSNTSWIRERQRKCCDDHEKLHSRWQHHVTAPYGIPYLNVRGAPLADLEPREFQGRQRTRCSWWSWHHPEPQRLAPWSILLPALCLMFPWPSCSCQWWHACTIYSSWFTHVCALYHLHTLIQKNTE